jgi:3-oxoacyl-[acyl-carrier protein] reductase
MESKKVALVTGASRGIGRACAIRLAMDGYDLIINYCNSEDAAKSCASEIEKLGRTVMIFKADVANENEVKDMYKAAIERFGKIDVLINNAGIFNNSYFIRQKESALNKMIETNIKGCVWCSKIALKYMMNNKQGKIINISSVSSLKGLPGESGYSLTKGAINALTRTMAKEAANYGVIVNAIAPGFIETNMTASMPESEKIKTLEDLPVKRFGKSEEVAELACFLASGKADYIVGQIISIDGGYCI